MSSFRTDKIRGRHPITPKKGISERSMSGNNDTIKVIKENYEKIMKKLDDNPTVYGTPGNRTREYFDKIAEYESAMKKDIQESGQPGITEYYMGKLYRVTQPTPVSDLTKRDINLKLEIARSDFKKYAKLADEAYYKNDMQRYELFKKYKDEYKHDIDALEEKRKQHIEPPHHTKRFVDFEILKKYLERGDTDSGLVSTDNNFQRNHPFHADTLQGMVDLGLLTKVDPSRVMSPYHTHYKLTSEARKVIRNLKREEKWNGMSIGQREKILKRSFPVEANSEGLAQFNFDNLDAEVQDKLKL